MIIVKRNLVKPSFYNELINKSDGVALYNTKTGKAVRIYGNRAMRAKAMLLNQAPQALNKDDDLQTSLYALQFLIDLSLDDEYLTPDFFISFDNVVSIIEQLLLTDVS